MEMLPPAPSVVVGAAVVKRFPGYGVHRGSIVEIDGNRVVVHWAATDERTTLTLKEAAKRVVASPLADEEDDDETAPYDHSNDPFLDGDSTIAYDSGDETGDYEGDGDAPTTSSRFWGVSWDRKRRKWRASYQDADGKRHTIGYYDEEEEAARARDQAIRDAGLEGKRHMNAVDATGALVPKRSGAPNRFDQDRGDRSAVVAPDPAHDPTAMTSKFWGVSWAKGRRRWQAQYKDATGKSRYLGLFDTQEAAAHAVNAAIRRAGLEGRRKTNPVVDGQLLPKPPGPHNKKRRREESAAAAPSPRARRR